MVAAMLVLRSESIMPKFTWRHLTYEFPEDVSVIVRDDEGCELCGPHLDFDFHKDGQIISAVDWPSFGIRRIDPIDYNDLI